MKYYKVLKGYFSMELCEVDIENLYPVVGENFELHLTGDKCTLFYIIKSNNKEITKLGLKEFKQWTISPMLAKYLILCDGIRTHKEIRDILSLPFSFIVDQSINNLIKITEVIELKQDKKQERKCIITTGSFESYNPIHIAMEITDYCNFRCKHCYVCASPKKLTKRDLKNTIELMNLLYDNGVKVIELTGGECTTHPDFKEILQYASKKFVLVSIITNGYIIGGNEKLAEYISSFSNVAVQISIDGLEEYHDDFRNVAGSFKRAVKAIKYLKKYGTIVRVATTTTEQNIEEIEELFKILKKLNIDSWAVSTVSSFGRGRCLNCNNKEISLNEKLIKVLGKYADDKMFKANKISSIERIKNKEINCGAGWRSFALNGATGNVRICLLLNETAIIGNVDKDNYMDIFNKAKLDIFRKTPSPSINSDTCKLCKYKDICNGCIAKAFETAKNINKDCNWMKKYKLNKYII